MAAPSLLPVFSPFTDGDANFGYGENFASPYPFSVKPDKPLKLTEIMAMMRDQYEGTEFDLTAGNGGTILTG
jgi:dipeptidase